MKKMYLTLVSSLLLFVQTEAQTGPGGVNNSTNNRVWLDASTLAQANGTTVASWSDKSGNGWIANTAASYTRPVFRTNQLNGFPAVDFDGSNDFLKINGVSGLDNQEISWFIVGNYNTTGVSQAMLHFAHSGSSYNKNLRFTLCYKSASINRINSGNLNTSGGGVPAIHDFNTGSQIFSTIIGSNTIDAYSNGSQTGSNTGTFLNPNTNSFVTLGRRAYLNDMYLNGNISEVIIFNYQLNSTEQTLVENYLSSKYAIGVSNDRYTYEGSGHYFNVAGVGQESGNAVINSEGGSGITITNLSSLDDDDYLLWGHNNAGLTENYTNIPAEMVSVRGIRLEQSWRFDETNDVGTYSFNIDMTGITLGSDPLRYVLLIDDDGDFSNGGTTIDSLNYSYDGGTEVATWDLVDIPDGSYVTVGWMPKTIYSITTGPWSDPVTWNCTCVPNFSTNVVVRNTHTVTVDVNSSSYSLTIEATGAVDFDNGMELDVQGDLNVAGTFDGTNGLLTLDGRFNQRLDLNTAVFTDITLNNTDGAVISSGTGTISGTLTVAAGDFDIGSGALTLLSDASSTARIGASNGTFTGTMNIQRFVSARSDGYSDMSSPVSNATFAQWADDFEIAFTPYVPNWSVPSAWGYSESNWDYFAIETSGTAITPGVGYEVYLDNDGLEATSFSSTTISVTGTPNVGDITTPVTIDNDGWNLIGNPYASFIDWDAFKANAVVPMNNTFMYYDETIEDFNTGTSGDVIAQSQGFWIEATAAGNVTFTESDKSTSMSSTYRNNDQPLFSLRVSSESIRFTSNTYFRFDENAGPDYKMNHDLSFIKVPGPKAPSLYTFSGDGIKLRINELVAKEELSIPVSFKAGINGNYSIGAINMESAEWEGYDVFMLEDTQLGIYHNLQEASYDFVSNTGDAENRFVLHLKKSENTAPVSALISDEVAVSFTNSSEGVFVNFNGNTGQMAQIKVYNIAGQEIVAGNKVVVNNNRVRIDIPSAYQGIYIIHVIMNDKIITQRFYKN